MSDVPSLEPPEGLEERMRSLVSLDIQRNAVLLSAIEASTQTVREDVRIAQQANMKMFNTLRDDFTDLRKEVREGFTSVNARIDDVRLEITNVGAEVQDLRTEMHEGISGLRTEMHQEINGLRTEMHTEIDNVRTEINGLRTEMHEQINGLRTEMHQEITGLRTEMHEQITGLRTEITEVRDEVKGINGKIDLILEKIAA